MKKADKFFNYRFIIAFTISLTMILAPAGTAYGAGYTDVKIGNWAYEAVNAMSERGIIKGYPNGSFLPNNTVTYGEFIKMALIAGISEDAGNAASGHWAMNYYNKALELKYFTEHDIYKSQLNDKITRADMALIISSILGDVKIDNYDKIQEGIEDITFQTPHEYDITKSYACGILTGYTDKTFRPDKTLSRAESATVIYRLADESKRVLPGVGEETATPTIEERLQGESDSGTVNLAESSTSALLLDDLVTNRADFRLLNHVLYYEIVNDYPFEISKWKDLLGVECITLSNVDKIRGAFIVKGNTLTMLSATGGYIYQVAGVKTASSFPDFDYIGFYHMNYDTMILVPNPF